VYYGKEFTVSCGEKGKASWIAEDVPDVKDYSSMVDLMAGQSNIFHLREIASICAANPTIYQFFSCYNTNNESGIIF